MFLACKGNSPGLVGQYLTGRNHSFRVFLCVLWLYLPSNNPLSVLFGRLPDYALVTGIAGWLRPAFTDKASEVLYLAGRVWSINLSLLLALLCFDKLLEKFYGLRS